MPTRKPEGKQRAGTKEKVAHPKFPLHEAIIEGDALKIEAVLKSVKKDEINRIAENGWTPLGLAIHLDKNNDSTKLIAQLINKKADLNKVDGNGWSPLGLAISHHKPDIVKQLIAQGVKLYTKNEQGVSPLDYAVAQGERENRDSEIVDLLRSASIKNKEENLDVDINQSSKEKRRWRR